MGDVFNFTSCISINVQAQNYADDPLIYHGSMKARFIYEFLTAIGQARDNLHLISLPLFLMHGDGDRLIPISASEFIHKNISSDNKTYEVCNNMQHTCTCTCM